jgi:hypothetical protein
VVAASKGFFKHLVDIVKLSCPDVRVHALHQLWLMDFKVRWPPPLLVSGYRDGGFYATSAILFLGEYVESRGNSRRTTRRM